MRRIYLDNAATSWPKPPAVYDAVDRYQRDNGTAVGRAATRSGAALQKTVDHCRRQLARLLGATPPASILFGFSGTDVLNQALHGWLRPGDHVVTSVAEHNSVLRPLRFLQDRIGLKVDYVPVDAAGQVDLRAFQQALTPATRLVAITHASNVTGALQPIEDLATIARKAGVAVLLDAAQTAGHVPLALESLPIDFLACSGHKGLLGPLGTGVLWIRPGREQELLPLRQGGTGTASDSEDIALSGVDRYEVGNHNAPGLVGLAAAVDWLLENGIDSLRRHEIERTAQLVEGLRGVPGLTIPGPVQASERVGTVSFLLEHLDPQTTASLLESEFGIETRAGLHCAPRMHAALGTAAQGGTVRASVGPFTSPEDIEALVQAVRALSGA